MWKPAGFHGSSALGEVPIGVSLEQSLWKVWGALGWNKSIGLAC